MISLTSRRGRYSAAIAALATATLVPGLLTLPASAEGNQLPAVPGLTRTAGVGERVPLGTIGDAVAGLVDIDVRGRTVASALQRTAATRLGAQDLRWNAFGTPASILPVDGVLAKATSSDPVTAARNYLVSNAAVFGSSREHDARPRARQRPGARLQRRPRGALPPEVRWPHPRAGQHGHRRCRQRRDRLRLLLADQDHPAAARRQALRGAGLAARRGQRRTRVRRQRRLEDRPHHQ